VIICCPAAVDFAAAVSYFSAADSAFADSATAVSCFWAPDSAAAASYSTAGSFVAVDQLSHWRGSPTACNLSVA
jgi:hypothetical protein